MSYTEETLAAFHTLESALTDSTALNAIREELDRLNSALELTQQTAEQHRNAAAEKHQLLRRVHAMFEAQADTGNLTTLETALAEDIFANLKQTASK